MRRLFSKFRPCVEKRPIRMNARAGQRGASLVEYAFVFIIFTTITFGIFGFSHMLYVYHYVNHAAKEATRYASVRGAKCSDDSSCVTTNSASGISGPTTDADVQTYVQNMVLAGVDSSKLAVPTTSTYLCGVLNTAKCSPVVDSAMCNSAAAINAPGCTVRVTVAYAYNFIFPLLPGSTSTTAPCTSAGYCLKSTSEMAIVH